MFYIKNNRFILSYLRIFIATFHPHKNQIQCDYDKRNNIDFFVIMTVRSIQRKDRKTMSQKPKKRKFEVAENETIDDCLNRMKEEGYFPVRRMEEPIFKEEKVNGAIEVVPYGRKIVFEGKLL